jgi:hypothetical protein
VVAADSHTLKDSTRILDQYVSPPGMAAVSTDGLMVVDSLSLFCTVSWIRFRMRITRSTVGGSFGNGMRCGARSDTVRLAVFDRVATLADLRAVSRPLLVL